MKAAVAVLVAAAALGRPACADPEAPQRCEELGDAVCRHFDEWCFTTYTLDECLALMDSELSCGDAIYVTAEYDECLAAVESAS